MDETSAPVESVAGETQVAQPSAIDQLPKWSGRGRPPVAIMKDIREKKVAFYKSKKKKQEVIKAISKFDLFLEEFIRNGGNATEAAWKVYNCKNRAVAATIGKTELQKAKDIGRVYMEAEGASYGKLLKVAIDKMADSKTPEWWDRLMKIAGYEDFLSKQKGVVGNPTIVNIIGREQRELASEYIEGEIVTDDGNNKTE